MTRGGHRSTARRATGVALAALALAALPRAADAQLGVGRSASVPAPGAAALEARVWLDRGDEPVVRTGDQLRVYYRASADAYVAIFRIDTDGTTSLLFPRSPDESHFVRGGRDYRLLFPRSPFWFVDDAPGLGYFFIIASPEPFDFGRFQFSHYDAGWDLGLVGRQVYRDPYLAMDDYVAALLPDWERVPYALDFASYNVGERHAYPRFLCYDCHGFRSYAAWNPYYSSCTNFRVVIYDDPYFYPARRYRADRVVWARPFPDRPRFAFKQRFPGDPAEPLLEQVVGERTRGVVAPAQRRTPLPGMGRAGPTVQTTPRGTPAVVRGRPEPSSAPTSGEREPARSTRPTDRVRAVPSGPVTAPGTGAGSATGSEPATGDRPAGVSAPAVDPRLRPVLRKRPSEGAGATAPGSASPPPQTTETRPGATSRTAAPRGGSRGAAPAPREPSAEQPSAGGSRERTPAVRRPSGDESGSAPRAGDAPTVRTTPDGRPVVRRPSGG